MENLRVVVNAEGDNCKENDFYSAYCVVESAPKILVISGRNTNTSAFTSILNAASCDYNVVSALNAPQDIDSMLSYKSIVLVDTYIDDLPIGFLENLETYVKEFHRRFPKVPIIGHREVAAKGCPSFDVQAWLKTIGINQ
jgi:hypothetical protein